MKSITERLEQAENFLDRGKNRKYFNSILLGAALAFLYPNLDKIVEYKAPPIQEFREELKKPYSGRKNDVLSLETITDDNLKKEIKKRLDEIKISDFEKIVKRINEYDPIIEGSSATHDIDDYLVAGVIYQESTGNRRAISPRGAMGLMQLTANTVEEVVKKYIKVDKKVDKKFTKENIFIPKYNIEIGTRYLSALIDMYEGNIIFGLAAYNMGPGAVDDVLRMRKLKPGEANYHNIKYLLTPETRAFIPKVFSNVLKMREGHVFGKDKIARVY